MADLNFGASEEVQTPEALNLGTDTTSQLVETPSNSSVNTNGLSEEELNDANKIKVTIADYKTPLIILFGAPSCGKTMTLVRLTRYLQSKGYTVQPETSFRPSYDTNYKTMCDNFDLMINSEDAAQSTSKISFMLVQVMQKGRPLCQILEGPGEYYFNPGDPKAAFPRYVNAIINSNNRKIWAIMLEPDSTNNRMDVEERKNYVNKIHKLKSKIRPQDKIMFVFNKIDETPFVIGPGKINYKETMERAKFLYPNIFVPFANENPITKWFAPNNFDFVAFKQVTFQKQQMVRLLLKKDTRCIRKNFGR